jgi:hypothetical protein
MPVLPIDVATPPGGTPGWRMSHPVIYRANLGITMISSEGGVALHKRPAWLCMQRHQSGFRIRLSRAVINRYSTKSALE